MKFKGALFALALTFSLVMGGLFAGTPAQAASGGVLQCAPFARQVSGIQLFGRAANWWHDAAGKYLRGTLPQVGSVLSFAASRAMPAGHVAMVSKVVSDREVLLTHANWSYRGGIERDVRAVDVSAAGDWSSVKVWYGPIGNLGLRPNVANGFIYAAAAPAPALPVSGVQMASLR
ncbi:CHAP domain-containing protein [Sphingobium sufflavum]|uniref:CHAP domain-containing protein n=1 Tax=Sphingobium sufflavum TaxID=1129547 RepID=UPI00389A391E